MRTCHRAGIMSGSTCRVEMFHIGVRLRVKVLERIQVLGVLGRH
jgi:hypothetical protein